MEQGESSMPLCCQIRHQKEDEMYSAAMGYDKSIVFLLLADYNWHCWKLLLTHQWAELLWASSWRRPSSPRALMEALLWILANQWRYIRLPPEWRWTTNTSAAVVNGRLKQRNSVLEPECNKSPGYILSLIRNAHCMAFANMKDWKNTFTWVGEAVGSFCSESPQRPQQPSQQQQPACQKVVSDLDSLLLFISFGRDGSIKKSPSPKAADSYTSLSSIHPKL